MIALIDGSMLVDLILKYSDDLDKTYKDLFASKRREIPLKDRFLMSLRGEKWAFLSLAWFGQLRDRFASYNVTSQEPVLHLSENHPPYCSTLPPAQPDR